MIALGMMAVAAAQMCPIERADYTLRSNQDVTVHFEKAPINAVWQQGVVLAVHGARTGRTSYWLPWYGGTDDRRHMRRTALLDRTRDVAAQRNMERSGDLDFFVLDARYAFLPELPKSGGAAPAHLLIPNLDLWHAGDVNGKRDASPRAFFDLVGCDRSSSQDRGLDVILPPVP